MEVPEKNTWRETETLTLLHFRLSCSRSARNYDVSAESLNVLVLVAEIAFLMSIYE